MRGHSQKGSAEVARSGNMPAERLATPGKDHWFDRLTKGLAQGGVSRRQMLGGSVAAGLGLLHPGRVLAKDLAPLQPTAPTKILPHAPPRPSPPSPTPQAGTCTISSEGRNQVVSVAAQTTMGTKVVAYTRQTTMGRPVTARFGNQLRWAVRASSNSTCRLAEVAHSKERFNMAPPSPAPSRLFLAAPAARA
jgi:hypothetical protein